MMKKTKYINRLETVKASEVNIPMGTLFGTPITLTVDRNMSCVYEKINELVDVINNIQNERNKKHCNIHTRRNTKIRTRKG
jgi:hypothetical protein